MTMRYATEHLPESIQELVDVVGIEAALKIVDARGGVRVCYPVKVTAGHYLEELVGLDLFKKLVEYYNGAEVEIPRCVNAMLAAKEQMIAAEAAAGSSNGELARRYGYTERGIRKLRRRVEQQQNSTQRDLFG